MADEYKFRDLEFPSVVYTATRWTMSSKEVMPKYKAGKLHSGSKTGPKVKNRKQAIAIMLSEKRAEKKGKLK